MHNGSIVLQAKNVSKSYPAKKGEDRLTILKNLDFELCRSSTVSVIGSSGSGKSTLLHILGGLDRPDEGDIFWDDVNITGLSDHNLAKSRNKKIGFVFQFHHLLPEFSALENVYMPLLIAGRPVSEAHDAGMGLLKQLGIAERASHRPSELSGGEQQRVAVARALINQPDIILADEPTGNLDDNNTEILLDILFDLNKQAGLSLVLVTHELEVARRATNIYELKGGKLHIL